MKKFLLFLIAVLCTVLSSNAQKQLVLCTTGYGFDKDASNGINPGIWTYIQKWVNLTHNGQDAGVTAVRLHIQWQQYEPTLGNYQGAKLAQAIAAIVALKPGMKVALHFPYQRSGPQPGQTEEGLLTDAEVARIPDGTKVQQTITYTIPSIYSQTGKTKFYNFVNDAMNSISAHYSNILYVQMGNGSAEEFIMPMLEKNGYHYPGMYEDAAVQAWRTQYLPCRYPGQTTVTWNGTTHNIASAPSVFPGEWNGWTSDHAKEYHRFASWGLMKFYQGFRDIVKSKSSSLKVLLFNPGFGTSAGNINSMHNSILPMSMTEFDGVYTSEGNDLGDAWRKIMPIDVLKGTNINKIAANEFDPEDLGAQKPTGGNPRPAGIFPGAAGEWIARSYKHGADYVHFAMAYYDSEIDQLAPYLATIKSTYITSGYTSPSRQSPVTANIFPNSFGGAFLFDDAWHNQDGDNWSVTDLSPKSVNMTDAGYWENIWNCGGAPPPCDYNVTASGPTTDVTVNTPNVTLSSTCSGQCTGVTYSWSGNGISGNNASVSFTAPSTPGTYTYTVTASKSGCSAKTANVSINVVNSGGGNPCGYVDKQTVGTWNGLNVQTRQFTVNGNATWLIVNTISGSSTDKHFPRGKNFADRGDVSWNGTFNKTCLGGGETGYNGLVIPSGITVPTGYTQGTEPDGAVYFQQSCTPPSAPSLSASPSTINSGQSSTLTATGCSGGTITWSHSLGTGTSKSVSPTTTTTYSATCSIGGCTSSSANVTVTVNPGNFNQCLESESSSGNGAVTSDPNASNGDTRGEQNNHNHYVDYAITGVPSAGTYYVTLRYSSSAAPTIGVQVNGGSTQTINLANSGSWNIVFTTHQFSVTLPAGNSTLRISGTGGGSCRQDKICVSNTSGSPVVLEPESLDELQANKRFVISPNPSKGIFETQFYLERGKKATIIVSDMQGRTIYRQQVTGHGQHKERINLNNKASGTLLLQLHTDGKTETKKLNIVR